MQKSEQSERLEHVRCPLCDADDAPLLHRVRDHLYSQSDEFTLVRCQRCGLTYLNPRPTLEALRRFYPDEYFCYQPACGHGPVERGMGGLVWFVNRPRIAQLERHVGRIPGSARVLDVGCGANPFLYHLRRLRGCRTLGIDFNASVVRAIHERLKMPAVHGTLPEAKLDSASFDGVAMYEYLEHEGRPREVLTEARRVTRPNGWLVVETPNMRSGLARLFGRKWCQLDAPRHLVLYDRDTIRKLLAQCGYEVIAVHRLTSQWMWGFSVLVAAGFRRIGHMGLSGKVLAVAVTLPVLPVPWLFPEFMRVYARAV